MDDMPSLLDLLHVAFEATSSPDEAYTLSRRSQIAPGISDVQYLDVSPGAAKLYGRACDEMIGMWLSLTHPMDVQSRARYMAFARHYDVEIPTRYISHILCPDASTVPVIKDTRQIVIRGGLYWFTHIKLASEEPDLPDINDIKIPDYNDYKNYLPTKSVAEVQALLQQEQKDSLPFGTQEPIIGKTFTESKGETMGLTIRKNRVAENGKPLTFGRPVHRTRAGQLLTECQRCAHVWNPVKQDDALVYDENGELIDIKVSDRCPSSDRCRNWMGNFTIKELSLLVASPVTA